MTYYDFIAKYNGKAIDYDGVAGVQCVDLIDLYLRDVLGITGIYVNGARDFYNKFSNYPKLTAVFERIPNTRTLVDYPADIVIWGGGTWGHCGLANGKGNIDNFSTYEQNTLGKHEPTTLIKHTYNSRTGVNCCNPVLGVLRLKPEYQHKSNPYYHSCLVTYPDGMNVRKGAGTRYKIITTIPTETKFNVTEISKTSTNTWGYSPDYQGWVCIDTKFVTILI